MKPKLLDLYCCAGGCSAGYSRAGFAVTGIDSKEQPNYPFLFKRADAIKFLLENGHRYDAIAASPPCQRYSKAATIHGNAGAHPDLVHATRAALLKIDRPFIMENVKDAPLLDAITLCGTMFNLRVFRHRIFESSPGLVLVAPQHHPKHWGETAPRGAYDRGQGRGGYVCVVGNNFDRALGAKAMGIDWPMTRKELSQAIPPAYTEFLGKQLLAYITGRNPDPVGLVW